jgi:hypothetical protein
MNEEQVRENMKSSLTCLKKRACRSCCSAPMSMSAMAGKERGGRPHRSSSALRAKRCLLSAARLSVPEVTAVSLLQK